jgi:hypothetical protein
MNRSEFRHKCNGVLSTYPDDEASGKNMRDYFVGQALTGLLANPRLMAIEDNLPELTDVAVQAGNLVIMAINNERNQLEPESFSNAHVDAMERFYGAVDA